MIELTSEERKKFREYLLQEANIKDQLASLIQNHYNSKEHQQMELYTRRTVSACIHVIAMLEEEEEMIKWTSKS